MNDEIQKSESEWRALLTSEQFYICRDGGTEPAFSGEYYNCKEEGVYTCICCNEPLFSSDTKFDSGSGWPSFFAPLSEVAIETEEDYSLFMHRIEVRCAKCRSHLGHVFSDGPEPTGLRYCINSTSLDLVRSQID